MRQRDSRLLAGIIVLLIVASFVAWPTNNVLRFPGVDWQRDIRLRKGLDLQGGVQVLLEADVPAAQDVSGEAMDAARGIVTNRVNALGVTEPNVQLVGERRIIVELPGIDDPDQAVASLRGTGLLEFIDAGATFLEPGTRVRTTAELGSTDPAAVATVTPAPSPTIAAAAPIPAGAATVAVPGATPAAAEPTPAPPSERIFRTVLTGKDLRTASVGMDEFRSPEINFTLSPEGAKAFADYTTANVGNFMAIVLDKTVISCPRVQGPIPDGEVRITGRFTLAEAQAIVVQLRYGSLPIPLRVIEQRTVGPTLGQDSVAHSVQAGVVGLAVVLLFMLVNYRLLGLLAGGALLVYAVLTVALFKLIPVTLTLPGVAGFLLSVGLAVDANILIFERMKEELRSGKGLAAAADAGFDRAWNAIRDPNLATLITCVILFWFGSNFGASAVKGFAVTLFLGVSVGMFTAIIVTRTLLRVTFALAGEALRGKHRLLGI